MRTALALIAGLMLAGCDPAPGTDRGVATRLDPVRGGTPAPALPAAFESEQITLGDRLSCREADLFAQRPATQAAWLTHGASLVCGVQAPGGPFAVCEGDGSLRLFGLPVLAVSVLGEGVEQGLRIRFRGDAATLAASASRALGVPFRRSFVEPGYGYDGLGVGARDYYVRPLESGDAVFGCSLPAPDRSAALPPVKRPDGWGVLSGTVAHSAARPPVLRVCAIDATDRERGHCMLTLEGDPHFRLPVPAGRWWLLAWPRGVDATPARHSAASACIANQGSDCDDRRLRAVELGVGEHRGGLPINDWAAAPEAGLAPPRAPLYR